MAEGDRYEPLSREQERAAFVVCILVGSIPLFLVTMILTLKMWQAVMGG